MTSLVSALRDALTSCDPIASRVERDVDFLTRSKMDDVQAKASSLATTFFASVPWRDFFHNNSAGPDSAREFHFYVSSLVAYAICLHESVKPEENLLRDLSESVRKKIHFLFHSSKGDSPYLIGHLKDYFLWIEKRFTFDRAAVPISGHLLTEVVGEVDLIRKLKFDPPSGKVFVMTPWNLAQRLLGGYSEEIKACLTPEDSLKVRLAPQPQTMVVADGDEVQSLTDGIFSLSRDVTDVSLEFGPPHLLYSKENLRNKAILYCPVVSSDIANMRTRAGLSERYTPSRPLRYVFAVIPTDAPLCLSKAAIDRLRACPITKFLADDLSV